MTTGLRSQLDSVRFGLAFGFVAVLYGWGLGVFFGVGEEWLRQGLVARAEAQRSVYVKAAGSEEGATAAIKRMDETTWRYFLRAHLHAGGIGSIAIGSSLVLALLSAGPGIKRLASMLLGIGAVGYPLFWMMAALAAPGLGSTAAAKASLRWLAIPSSGALVVGGALTLGLVIADLFVAPARHARAAAGQAA
jgi:hypothetical protein